MKLVYILIGIVLLIGSNPASGYLVLNNSTVNGLNQSGNNIRIEIVEINSTLYAIEKTSSGTSHMIYGYAWNGTGWDVNITIIQGLPADIGQFGSLRASYNYSSLRYELYLNNNSFHTYVFYWNGSSWIQYVDSSLQPNDRFPNTYCAYDNGAISVQNYTALCGGQNLLTSYKQNNVWSNGIILPEFGSGLTPKINATSDYAFAGSSNGLIGYRNISGIWTYDNKIAESTGLNITTYSTYPGIFMLNDQRKVLVGTQNGYIYGFDLERSNFTLISHANGSTGISTPTTLNWQDTSYQKYQVATDDTFINLVSSGTGTAVNGNMTTSAISLNANTKYYWRVQNMYNLTYTYAMNFTTAPTPVITGYLNITAFDELNTSQRIQTFEVRLFNTTSMVSLNATSGWANFSNVVVGSQYLIQFHPNASYVDRYMLATPNATVTMYSANTTNTIYTVRFNLKDASGLFSYKTSRLYIYNGDLLVQLTYADSGGNFNAYLIQNQPYHLILENTQNGLTNDLGNYIPITSETAPLTITKITNITINTNPFIYNLSVNNNIISLQWIDQANFMNSLTYDIYYTTTTNNIYHIITTTNYGILNYTMTATGNYYITIAVLKMDGTWLNSSRWINYDTGVRKSSTGVSQIDGTPIGTGFKWDFGTFVMPDWFYNTIAIIVLILLASAFSSQNAGIGGIILSLAAIVLHNVGWLFAGNYVINPTLALFLVFSIILAMKGR